MGDKGKMVFGAPTAGTNPGQAGPIFIPESLRQSYQPPEKTIPRVKGKIRWGKPSRHEDDWIRACKDSSKRACSRFEISGPLTEMVLLGNVALFSGKPIEWNRNKMKIVNEHDANQYLRRKYRSGYNTSQKLG